jgi:nicotinamidase-related amidase
MVTKIGMKTLILTDLQNDSCPGGELAVPEGDLLIPWPIGCSRISISWRPTKIGIGPITGALPRIIRG